MNIPGRCRTGSSASWRNTAGPGAARLEQMMMNTSMLTKDLGTILVGEEAVKEGLIDAVGGISHAVRKLRKLCRQGKKV